jgi:hypothetical protein
VKRLLALLASFGVTAGSVMALNWWVNPLGDFYVRPAAVQAQERNCLLSNDIIGGTDSLLKLKLDLVRMRDPATVVFGTSRVMQIGAHAGERRFVNFGLPSVGLLDLPRVLTRLHAVHPGPLRLYLGVELFWTNPNWRPPFVFGKDPSLASRLRGLLARQRLSRSLSLVKADPALLTRRWHVVDVGGHCAVDRTDRVAAGLADAWWPDGSLAYTSQLRPDLRTAPSDDFTRDLGNLSGPNAVLGYYTYWTKLANLDALSTALRLAAGYGWNVVGFTPPYSTRWIRRLASAPETAARWREFGPAVRSAFNRFGYTYLDSRLGRTVGCTDRQYLDDGWHVDRRCAALLRKRLDTLAAAADA